MVRYFPLAFYSRLFLLTHCKIEDSLNRIG